MIPGRISSARPSIAAHHCAATLAEADCVLPPSQALVPAPGSAGHWKQTPYPSGSVE